MVPLVSVIVPTYQHVHFIEQCLQGILIQKISFSIEVLVGDDGSTDGTSEICDRIARTDPRVQVFHRDRKDVIYIMGRPTGRRNLLQLLKDARGQYVAICEGDDHWTDPLKLEKQVAILESDQGCSLCFHRARLLKGDDLQPHPIPESVDLEKEISYLQLLQHYNFITTASIVFRNNSITWPDWLKEIPFADMGIIWLLSKRGSIKCVKEYMSTYRIVPTGLWSQLNREDQLFSYLRFYKIMYPLFGESEKQIVREKWKRSLDELAGIRSTRGSLQKLHRRILGLKHRL